MNKWDARFIQLAKHVAEWSKDPSTKCGAIITQGNQIISLGFNGFAKGCDDNPELYNNREHKYKRILHAEQNALLFANQDITGATCYIWPMPPCSTCCAMLIQKGIKHIVAAQPSYEQTYRWGSMFDESKKMCKEAEVELHLVPEASYCWDNV